MFKKFFFDCHLAECFRRSINNSYVKALYFSAGYSVSIEFRPKARRSDYFLLFKAISYMSVTGNEI